MKARQWFVGIDWASEEHQVCVLSEGGEIVGERVVVHSGEGISEMCSWLKNLSGGGLENVNVAIEVPHGAVVETLLERGAVVHSINPKQLDRFRDRFTVAGAKDDRRDAHVLADSLRTDAHCFRRLEAQAAVVIELREWSRMAEELQVERTRLGNRIGEQLRRYYPQLLELSEDIAAEWFLDLWEKAPTPAQAARMRESTVARILKQHRIRRVDAATVLQTLRREPLRVSAGTVAAATAHMGTVVARVRLVNRQLKQARKRLDELTEELGAQDPEGEIKREHSDVEILHSAPGIGRIILATLLAEASQPLRERDYHHLRTLTGVAPVTRRSGKSTVVVMRYACHPRLRNAVYHWAWVAVQRDVECRARYAALRARGHKHGRALRTVADRLLAVICAMLRNDSLYDSSYRAAQQQAATA